MKDDPEFNITFVSTVQQFPCLYDNTSLDYSNKTLQLKAWETIAGRVNESVLDCKDRWKNLRGCFTRHLKNKSGEAFGHRYRKPYYLAQHLNFLLPFTKSRLQISNDLSEGVQNEDEDTIADDDGDDNNNYNGDGDEANGVDGQDDLDEHDDRNDGDPEQQRNVLSKRLIKAEPTCDGNGKWSNCLPKRTRLDRQASDDSDLHFLKSLLPDMRAMDGSQKRRLKIGILQLCEDILNEASFHTEGYVNAMDDSENNESSKQFLERLFHSNSDRLVIKANDKGKNPMIWSRFDIAYIDGIEQKYACCKFCNGFIKYTGRTGTGGLMRHFCYKNLNGARTGRIHKRGHLTRIEDSDYRPSVRLEIETLMHNNSPRIGYVRNAKGKSEVWSQFKMITVDNVLSTFACCTACKSLVTYMSRTGTGSMTRHKCQSKNYAKRLIAAEDARRMEADADADADPMGIVIKTEESYDWDEREGSDDGSDNETGSEKAEGNVEAETADRVSGIPTEVERVLQEKRSAVLNKSLQLLDIFHNEEFTDLAQFLVDLGARHGRFDVKRIFSRKMSFVTPQRNK